MDYEKKYKEALEKARQLCAYPVCKPFISDLQDLFPELADLWDERIRKCLIAIITDFDSLYLQENYSLSREDALAWIEKQGQTFTKKDIDDAYLKGICDAKKEFERQGEKKPILDVEIPFGAKDSELEEVSYSIPNGYHAEIEDNKVIIKKGEQKSSWSEEDEREVDILKAYICSREWSDSHIDRALGIVDELVKKLKSLRPQSIWKPIEEEMKALEETFVALGGYDNNLRSLINDLKKLK